jgi:hypothetical protein
MRPLMKSVLIGSFVMRRQTKSEPNQDERVKNIKLTHDRMKQEKEHKQTKDRLKMMAIKCRAIKRPNDKMYSAARIQSN